MRQKLIMLALATVAALGVIWFATTGTFLTFERAARADDQVAAAIDRSVAFSYGTPIRVLKVVDGDTVELINGEYVRYNGIDTPEEYDPRKNVQCYAVEAAAENERLITAGGNVVTVEQDVSYKDKYGRWIGIVHLADGTSVNLALVQEGFAFAYKYKPDIAHADEFAAAETAARAANLGLWGVCTVYQTSSGREQTNDI